MQIISQNTNIKLNRKETNLESKMMHAKLNSNICSLLHWTLRNNFPELRTQKTEEKIIMKLREKREQTISKIGKINK